MNNVESIVTNNKRGRTSSVPNELSQRFIDYCSSVSLPVIDIGCATGVATLPAAANGARVIAVDLDAGHLSNLRSAADRHGIGSRVLPVRAEFPRLEFIDGSLGAIHASNLLNFLSGQEIRDGFQRLYRWCSAGGRVFVISGTPYAANVKGFIPEYERRVREGWPWPGEVEQLSQYSCDSTLAELPDSLHLLDDMVLAREALGAGFEVLECRMFKRLGTPPYIEFDGRENVMLIAVRQ